MKFVPKIVTSLGEKGGGQFNFVQFIVSGVRWTAVPRMRYLSKALIKATSKETGN